MDFYAVPHGTGRRRFDREWIAAKFERRASGARRYGGGLCGPAGAFAAFQASPFVGSKTAVNRPHAVGSGARDLATRASWPCQSTTIFSRSVLAEDRSCLRWFRRAMDSSYPCGTETPRDA